VFYLGLDLGQKKDHSAVAVVERKESGLAFQNTASRELVVRHVERVPLGMPYPMEVEGVRNLMQSRVLARQCALVVDSTGVGGPVVDLLKRADLGGRMYAVTITGGEKEHESGGVWSVPKRNLIAGVEVLLDNAELKVAAGLRDGVALARELTSVKGTVRPSGRTRYGADGYGEHDDLVIALALACWGARRPRGIIGTQRLF